MRKRQGDLWHGHPTLALCGVPVAEDDHPYIVDQIEDDEASQHSLGLAHIELLHQRMGDACRDSQERGDECDKARNLHAVLINDDCTTIEALLAPQAYHAALGDKGPIDDRERKHSVCDQDQEDSPPQEADTCAIEAERRGCRDTRQRHDPADL